jgi:type IV secretion system protein VirB8
VNKETQTERAVYYRQAATWSQDRQDALRRSKRIAWIVASGAALIAILEAFALMLLTPLKTVEPYTLLVDRHTGYVQALKPLTPGSVSPDTALTQSFLVQYVIARESFDSDLLQSNYRKVALWSADTARSTYIASMQTSNPASPIVRYPRTAVVETQVKSVSSIGRDRALVRFETSRHDAGGPSQAPTSWVAMIRYRFSTEPMSVEDRYLNPLGFQVVHYQRDAETLPTNEPTPRDAAATTSLPPFQAGRAAAPAGPSAQQAQP